MKKTWRMAALVVCASMFVSGCTLNSKKEETPEKESEKTETKAPEEKEYQAKLDAIDPAAYNNAEGLQLEKGSYISIIGKGKDSQFWEDVELGAQQAAKDINAELGYEGKDKVKVTYSAPSATDNVDEQVNILDEELARYPVALGISIVDEKACSVQFDLATESGIPVVAFDSGSDYQGLLAMVSTDNTEAAKTVADRLAESMKHEGEVIIFANDSKSRASRERIQGFQQEMKEKYPKIAIVDTYYMDQLEEMQKKVADEINAGTWTRSKENTETEATPESITEEDVVDYILSKHPNVKGVYGTNGNATLLAAESIERQQFVNDVVLVGFDAFEEEVTALEEGKIDGLLVQNPFGMGYATVIAAARAALNMGNEAYVDTGYTWVTQDNLEDKNIQKML